MQSITRGEIWKTLSNTDCSAHIVTDDEGIPVIQVMAAHALMMSAYPEYTYQFLQDAQGRELHYLDDGSAEVRLLMTVEGHAKTVSLPIHRNMASIKNPSSWDLNTAKQRLRVRAMGEFGLAHTLWIKENSAAKEPDYLAETAGDRATVDDDTSMAAEYWAEADLNSCTNVRALDRRHNRYLNALRTSKIDNDPYADDFDKLKAIKCKLWESSQ